MGGYNKHQNRLPPFVPLICATLDAPAWRNMSHGARSLYTALKRRYGTRSSTSVFLSQRMAANELGSHHNECCRWFRELEFYGFIVNISRGSLGVDGKGKAPHWRLTELPYHDATPTRDFLKWDGSKFKDKKTESRAGNGARGVPENHHTSVPESQPVNCQSVPENQHIENPDTVPEMAHITRLPLPRPLLPAADPEVDDFPVMPDFLRRTRRPHDPARTPNCDPPARKARGKVVALRGA